MRRHELHVTVTLEELEDLELPEDQAVLLFQSVRELLMNVVKHAQSNQATVKLERRGEHLCIAVQDAGRGFEIPVSPTAAPSFQSARFGLFSIRERMKALGGQFELESEPGTGTTATLLLPVNGTGRRDDGQKARDAESRAPLLAASPGAHRIIVKSSKQGMTRVLLVDDHAMMRQGLRSMLETYADVEVVGEACDGEEALEQVERIQPSMVIMDINMPKLNGMEATARIKQRHPSIKVIGLSVNAGPEVQEAMRQAGAETCLTKEAAVEQLYSVILGVLKGD
jgi:CheY-like chemotaxis protein/anti-sigma regulatory factor (Ser/Thr protein kinase)